MTKIDIRPTETKPEVLAAHRELFRNAFPSAKAYTAAYLEWLYKQNPAGTVVGYDAWEGDKLAATYVTVPAPVLQREAVRPALLSLNTATHERYRGQGLFTRLANATYQLARERNFEIVFGVANANSVGGFTKKLGFQDLGSLSARIGIGRIGASPELDVARLDFARYWDAPLLEWRTRNPSNPITLRKCAQGFIAQAPTHLLPIRAYAFLPSNLIQDPDCRGNSGATICRPINIALGLWAGKSDIGLNFELPRRLRPSPLRLIHKDLNDQKRLVDAAQCFMTFLDFDAF